MISNNNQNSKEIINEESLYNSLCFLSFELLLDSLISIGYENDIDTIGTSKTLVLNRLVNDARELGIEEFIQRLNFDTITETCSLLSLSGVNGDTDDEILSNSRKQLEERMKKDSLDQFFFSLTPHILYKFCDCLKILLPKPTENGEENGRKQNQVDDDQSQSSSSEEVVTKTISNSIPSIKVGADGTTVLSTLTTKSSYKKFKKDRGIQYGDSIVEGLFYENIIRLLKEEILVSGTENLFSFLSKAKLYSICDCLKIIIKPSDKMSEIITKIISKLFNIDHNVSQQSQNQTIISTSKSSSSSSSSSSQQQHQQHQPQLFSTPIRSKSNLQYPKTPLSPDDDDDSISPNILVSEEIIGQEKEKIIEEEEKEEKLEKEETNDDINDNNIINNKSTNKRKYDEVDELSVHVIITETDDSEIDQPAKRPSIIDIKMGIKKQDLESYLAKDLRSWCQNKGIKYNDKKSILIDRILKYLEIDQATSASENDDSIIDSTPTKRSKRLKKQSSSSNLSTTTTSSASNLSTTITSSSSSTTTTTTNNNNDTANDK
ncbi:hypothetical protein RB653_009058 [Dictyostelium firmibasis]|uniref:SAP domain-containing protein n=1 Tax=Dictyostelium firmibasis TaxID=79012 RepID=A0AAN7YT38_9MYCE